MKQDRAFPPATGTPAAGGRRALISHLLRRSALALPLTALSFASPACGEPPPRPPVNATPVNDFDGLSRVLTACWVPPPGTQGSEITFRFGLTAKGELRGRPIASHSVLMGTPEAKRAFVAAAITAFSRCTPVLMSPDFARVAAARVLILRFVSPGREA